MCHSDIVKQHHDEGICDRSRVFFLDSAHRMTHAGLDSEIPSVNIRGIMDPVRFTYCACNNNY